MQHVFAIAEKHLGTKEWPGATHNPAIIKMFEDTGNGRVKDDETAWCAAFVGSVLASAGIRGTGLLAARSYQKWGEEVPLSEAEPGDVVVFWRGKRDGWQGHVGFFAGRRPSGDILVLGGNQGDAVSIAPYPRDRLLAVRRAKAPRTSMMKSTTLQAGVVAEVGNIFTAFQVLPQLEGKAQVIALGGFIAIALGLMWIRRERIRKWALGDR